MTDDVQKSKKPTGLAPDPNNVPVVFANIFGGGGVVNGVINFTLCVNRFTPTFDGPIEPDAIVAARLRIDLETAVFLRDFLSQQVNLMATPKDKAN